MKKERKKLSGVGALNTMRNLAIELNRLLTTRVLNEDSVSDELKDRLTSIQAHGDHYSELIRFEKTLISTESKDIATMQHIYNMACVTQALIKDAQANCSSTQAVRSRYLNAASLLNAVIMKQGLLFDFIGSVILASGHSPTRLNMNKARHGDLDYIIPKVCGDISRKAINLLIRMISMLHYTVVYPEKNSLDEILNKESNLLLNFICDAHYASFLSPPYIRAMDAVDLKTKSDRTTLISYKKIRDTLMNDLNLLPVLISETKKYKKQKRELLDEFNVRFITSASTYLLTALERKDSQSLASVLSEFNIDTLFDCFYQSKSAKSMTDIDAKQNAEIFNQAITLKIKALKAENDPVTQLAGYLEAFSSSRKTSNTLRTDLKDKIITALGNVSQNKTAFVTLFNLESEFSQIDEPVKTLLHEHTRGASYQAFKGVITGSMLAQLAQANASKLSALLSDYIVEQYTPTSLLTTFYNLDEAQALSLIKRKYDSTVTKSDFFLGEHINKVKDGYAQKNHSFLERSIKAEKKYIDDVLNVVGMTGHESSARLFKVIATCDLKKLMQCKKRLIENNSRKKLERLDLLRGSLKDQGRNDPSIIVYQAQLATMYLLYELMLLREKLSHIDELGHLQQLAVLKQKPVNALVAKMNTEAQDDFNRVKKDIIHQKAMTMLQASIADCLSSLTKQYRSIENRFAHLKQAKDHKSNDFNQEVKALNQQIDTLLERFGHQYDELCSLVDRNQPIFSNIKTAKSELEQYKIMTDSHCKQLTAVKSLTQYLQDTDYLGIQESLTKAQAMSAELDEDRTAMGERQGVVKRSAYAHDNLDRLANKKQTLVSKREEHIQQTTTIQNAIVAQLNVISKHEVELSKSSKTLVLFQKEREKTQSVAHKTAEAITELEKLIRLFNTDYINTVKQYFNKHDKRYRTLGIAKDLKKIQSVFDNSANTTSWISPSSWKKWQGMRRQVVSCKDKIASLIKSKCTQLTEMEKQLGDTDKKINSQQQTITKYQNCLDHDAQMRKSNYQLLEKTQALTVVIDQKIVDVDVARNNKQKLAQISTLYHQDRDQLIKIAKVLGARIADYIQMPAVSFVDVYSKGTLQAMAGILSHYNDRFAKQAANHSTEPELASKINDRARAAIEYVDRLVDQHELSTPSLQQQARTNKDALYKLEKQVHIDTMVLALLMEHMSAIQASAKTLGITNDIAYSVVDGLNHVEEALLKQQQQLDLLSEQGTFDQLLAIETYVQLYRDFLLKIEGNINTISRYTLEDKQGVDNANWRKHAELYKRWEKLNTLSFSLGQAIVIRVVEKHQAAAEALALNCPRFATHAQIDYAKKNIAQYAAHIKQSKEQVESAYFDHKNPAHKALFDKTEQQTSVLMQQEKRLSLAKKLADGMLAKKNQALVENLHQDELSELDAALASVNTMAKHVFTQARDSKQAVQKQNTHLSGKALKNRIDHLTNSLKVLSHRDGWRFQQLDQAYNTLQPNKAVVCDGELKTELDLLKKDYLDRKRTLEMELKLRKLEQSRREAVVYKQKIKGILQLKHKKSFDYKTLSGKERTLFWHHGRKKIDRLTKALDDLNEPTLTKAQIDNELNKDISQGVGKSAITRNRHAAVRFFASAKRNKHNPTGTYQSLKKLGWKPKIIKK